MITKFRSWCEKDKEPLAERTCGQYLSATNDIVLFIAARNPGTDGFTEEKNVAAPSISALSIVNNAGHLSRMGTGSFMHTTMIASKILQPDRTGSRSAGDSADCF